MLALYSLNAIGWAILIVTAFPVFVSLALRKQVAGELAQPGIDDSMVVRVLSSHVNAAVSPDI